LAESKALKVYKNRVTEQYILDQVLYHFDSESFSDHKRRVEDGDRLYKGDLAGLFPDEQALPDTPLVENKFKNAIHDCARLAAEGRGLVKAIPRGDRDRDMKGARVAEAIDEGYWTVNRMRYRERKLYLDLIGTGMMALSVFYNDDSPYPQIRHLDPRFCYPDVVDGRLSDMLYVQTIKRRQAARLFPGFEIDVDGADSSDVMLVAYYDDEGVSEALTFINNDRPERAIITKQWAHDLGVVPVAFEMLDTYDGAFHGLFEQLSGPLMVRNKIVRFMVDYIESIAHSPLEARGIINADTPPGPDTVYQHDLTEENTHIGRVPPAAPAGSLFGLLQYMEGQEERESIQPPSRVGNVSQSIASGSFVDRTQGQLTSLIKELQDKVASLREQANLICNRVDEVHLNVAKPLLRPVSGQKMYTPSKDIDGWYLHEVKFGAGAGLDRLNADGRVLNHLAARLISREEGRAEIDYLDDSASSQDKVDREALADAILQRFVRDPAVPMSSIARTWLLMKKDGKSLDEALDETVPEMLAAEAAAAPQPGPEQMGGTQGGASELGQVNLPLPPLQQLFVRQGS